MAIITIKDKNGNLIDIPALQGQNGKSAYEYAKEQGFTGTEEEFAQTLVKTPLATNTTPGVVQGYTYYGHTINSSGAIMHEDPTTQIIDSRRKFYPVTTSTIDYATKAALTDGVGAAWTEEEKASAKERLGVVDTPVATKSSLGIVGVNASMGIDISNVNGTIYVAKATDEQIDARTNEYKPIVPKNLDYAVKSALCDGKGAEWTEEEKIEARKRIGIDGDLLIKETIVLEEDLIGAMSIELPTPCEQVLMLVKQPQDTTSITLYSGVIFEDQYSTGAGNLMNSAATKPNGYVSYKLTLLDNGIVKGVTSNNSGVVNQILSQFTDQIGKKIAKVGLSSISATLPKGTEIIVFGGNKSINIGSSSNGNGISDVIINDASVVTDGVANIPIANTWNKLGIVKCGNGYGLKVNNSGELSVDAAQISNIDNRTVGARLITTERLDYAVKAAMADGKGVQWSSEEKANARMRLGEEWRYIGKVETAEDVARMEMTLDNEGNPFNLRKVRVKVVNYPNASNLNTSIRLCFNNKTADIFHDSTMMSGVKTTETMKRCEVIVEKICNHLFPISVYSSLNNGSASMVMNSNGTASYNNDCCEIDGYINQIYLYSWQMVIGAGAYMEVWGVDA